MNTSQEILKFKMLNITEYINKNYPTYEDSVMSNSKNELTGLLDILDRNIYKYFVLEGDSILNLLDIYKRCLETLTNFKTVKVDIDEEENVAVSGDLKKRFSLFVEDMAMFLTSSRYLVAYEFFNSNDKIYCILSNDLLFVGEKTESQKYTLKRYFNIKSTKIEIANDDETEKVLKITVDGDSFVLKGSNKKIESFYEAVQELNFEYLPENEKPDEPIDFCKFCLETRRFQDLLDHLQFAGNKSEFILNFVSESIDNLEIMDENELSILIKIHRHPSKFFSKYFISKFKKDLEKINRIVRIFELIGDVFIFLENFTGELILLGSKYEIPQKTVVLTVENLVIEVFTFLEPRIFGSSFIRNNPSEIIAQIKQKLTFSGLSFRYLAKKLEKKICSKPSNYFEQAKLSINTKLKHHLE